MSASIFARFVHLSGMLFAPGFADQMEEMVARRVKFWA